MNPPDSIEARVRELVRLGLKPGDIAELLGAHPLAIENLLRTGAGSRFAETTSPHCPRRSLSRSEDSF